MHVNKDCTMPTINYVNNANGNYGKDPLIDYGPDIAITK